MTTVATQRSEPPRIWELVLIFALLASSRHSVWTFSHDQFFVLEMAVVDLCVLVIWARGQTDFCFKKQSDGFEFQIQHKS